MLEKRYKNYPADRTIQGLFVEQVEKTPHSIAVVGDVGAKHSTSKENGNASPLQSAHLSYRELNKNSNQLAHLLREKGVGRGVVVGIMVGRSLEMVIGLLAILKTGAAYLPLNPKNPVERNGYMLKDSNTKILLTTRSFCREVEKLRSLDIETLFIDEGTGEALPFYSGNECFAPTGVRPSEKNSVGARRAVPSEPVTCNLQPVTSPSNLAYIIYTSGSTGKPKGVPITHANLSPLLHWGYEQLRFGPEDRAIQNLSYYFDWSVWEIFMILTSGAALYMVNEETLLNPDAMAGYIRENKITILHLTPTQLQFLLEAKQQLQTLQYLVIGAEKLTYNLVERSYKVVNKECRLFNMYGPTEATIISAVLEINRNDYKEFNELTSIPIGKAVANIDLLVLDENMAACPDNRKGELYIAGDCLSGGYLTDPEKSADSFIGNIFRDSGIAGERLYKTGDLVRRLPDGNIEFLGRVDHQVKIRGFRIELGEIEKRLLAHDAVEAAVVTAREDTSGNKFLCAYIVAAAIFCKPEDSSDELRQYLSLTLPDYMIPASFVILDHIPLNPNGKVDLKALPEPEIINKGKEFAAPRDQVEEKIVEIWAKVLSGRDSLNKSSKISIDDKFLEIGGHSLQAALVTAEIHKQFNVRISLEKFLQLSTVSKLAGYIKKAGEEKHEPIPKTEKKEYYSLSPAQKRLYILDSAGDKNTSYNIPLVFELESKPDLSRLTGIFGKLIIRHESFRTSFHMIADEPVQTIHPPAAIEFELEYFEIGNRQEAVDIQPLKPSKEPPWRVFPQPAARNSQLVTSAVERFIHPFDLTVAPLLRAALIRFTEEKYSLLVDMHHIISDGVSVEIFQKEMIDLYNSKELLPLKLQYRDYSGWKNKFRDEKKPAAQKQYWLDKFSGELPLLDLPLDFIRPAVQSFAGETIRFQLDRQKVERLKALARNENTTLYMVLLAVFNVFLAKLSGQEDIIVGTASAGRRHADLENMIGMFIDTLPLRNFPRGEKSFTIFLQEIRQTTLEAFENQEYQFEDLIEELKLERDVSRNPLFDVMFVLQNMRAGEFDRGKLEIQPYKYISTTSKFDLTLIVEELAHTLSFEIEYSTKLFTPVTINRFINYFKEVIRAVLIDPGKKLSDIGIMSSQERSLIMEEFNHKLVEYPQGTVVGLLNEPVDLKPDNIACFDEGNYLTYKELNIRANVLAKIIKEL